MRLFTKKVRLGGKRVVIGPLSLENALKLILLLAPYLALAENKMPEIKRALATTGGQRPQLFSTVFRVLRNEMAQFPGDMTHALALLTGKDASWIAGNVTAREFVEALPILDEINDLAGLFWAVQALGITARYRDGNPTTDY